VYFKFIFKLIKIKAKIEFLRCTSYIYSTHKNLWLVAIALGSRDLEHFQHVKSYFRIDVGFLSLGTYCNSGTDNSLL
jgi:hypothetical protein